MYKNVIVHFEGTSEGRSGLAVAGDLAWRCGAKLVIVNNTEASGRIAKEAIKSRAMSQSGADVDFWIDTGRSLGEALVEAARYREDSVICVSTKTRGSVFSKRSSLPSFAEEVFRDSEVPVFAVGPNADTSQGLPMTEIVVSTDGSAASERVVPLAAAWARELKLTLLLIGVVPERQTDDSGELDYLATLLDGVKADLHGARFELLKARDPATGILQLLERHGDAVLAMATHGRTGAKHHSLGTTARKMLERSPRGILFAPACLAV